MDPQNLNVWAIIHREPTDTAVVLLSAMKRLE
jgi:hypothetical protein